MSSVREHLPGHTVRMERFTRDFAREPLARAFEAILPDGRQLHVPANRSLFDVLVEAGLPLRGVCMQGVCGSCEIGVENGVVDHRDFILDEREQELNSMMFHCVSRAYTAELVVSP